MRDLQYSDTSVLSPFYFPSLIQQVKKFTSCLLFTVKNQILTLGTPPKYMVVTRELKFIFLHTLTCSQCTCRTGYNFMCNLLSKIWILMPLMWNCPLYIKNIKVSEGVEKIQPTSGKSQTLYLRSICEKTFPMLISSL